MAHIDRSFWKLYSIEPIPTLAHLRDRVLAHSSTRYPKWKFRLASDLVLQLQPKPAWLVGDTAKEMGIRQHTVDFEGRALFAANLTRDAFTKPGVPFVSFKVFAEEGESSWQLRPQSAQFRCRDPLSGVVTILDPFTLMELFLSRFTAATFVKLPAVMLSPHCLFCGKALTDPASMARYIGPECFGSASLTVPRTLQFDEDPLPCLT
jgi:hypothetical protein